MSQQTSTKRYANAVTWRGELHWSIYVLWNKTSVLRWLLYINQGVVYWMSSKALNVDQTRPLCVHSTQILSHLSLRWHRIMTCGRWLYPHIGRSRSFSTRIVYTSVNSSSWQVGPLSFIANALKNSCHNPMPQCRTKRTKFHITAKRIENNSGKVIF